MSTATAAPRARSSFQNRQLQARFDAAQTTYENASHWSFADALSADAANAPQIRRTLRNRARYEIANNGYAQGLVRFMALDVVGRTVRLNLIGDMTREEKRFVEGEVFAAMEAADLFAKGRVLTQAEIGDGESMGVLVTNPGIDSPVKLDVRAFECDYVQSPMWGAGLDPYDIDGILFDQYWNAKTYLFQRAHPGGSRCGTLADPIPVPAAQVIHLFTPDRPGQHRGVSELTPSLPLFAQLRRFTLAVLGAAETAADVAGILYTTAADTEADRATPFERIEIERRALLTMPDGYDMRQFKAEQPVSTYKEFKRELLGEIARPHHVPVNILLGDSSEHNFASAKLDGKIWRKARDVRRSRFSRRYLDRFLTAWIREAILIEGYLPQSLRSVSTDWAHEWRYDDDEFSDAAKEASGQATRLENNTTSLSVECARQGLDWEEVLEQRARERALMRELGLEDES